MSFTKVLAPSDWIIIVSGGWCWCRPQCSAVEILLRARWQLWGDNCSIVTSPLWETRGTFPNFSILMLDENNFLLLRNKSVSSVLIDISLTPPSLPQCRPALTSITIVTVVLSRHINTGPESASAQQEGLRVRLSHYPTFPPGAPLNIHNWKT